MNEIRTRKFEQNVQNVKKFLIKKLMNLQKKTFINSKDLN